MRFSFKLALALGMTRRELMGRMTSEELSGWIAYDRVDPLPDPYWCAARVALAVSQSAGNKRARFEHYLPKRGTANSGPRQSPKVMWGVFKRAINRARQKDT